MNVTRVGQVHFFYRAKLTSDQFDPGHETQEARLFSEQEVPWDELAFRTVKETLQHYFADAKTGQFHLHHVDIT
jgi:ADP-ribose pyrophosphatase YjhB (NUDIX family)